eukprot:9705299-Lingulodinium_polyedra.AAC.1
MPCRRLVAWTSGRRPQRRRRGDGRFHPRLRRRPPLGSSCRISPAFLSPFHASPLPEGSDAEGPAPSPCLSLADLGCPNHARAGSTMPESPRTCVPPG